MSDVYMPGVKSRFNTEKIIEGLMNVERIPRDNAQKNIDSFENRKTWWQDFGQRVDSLRESARMLFSFQNPFNERTAVSSNENIISATVTREAGEQEYRFTVRQLAQADRYLSAPLDEKMQVEAGTYTFSIGKDTVPVNFRGGTLRDFVDALNRQGRDKIGASLLTIKPGTRSLLLESKITGAENRLDFSGDAGSLAMRLGLVERVDDSPGEAALVEAAEDNAFESDTLADEALTDGTPENGESSIAAGDDTADTPVAASQSLRYKPINAVSIAQDAIISMEGIDMTRPSNIIDDMIPGVTITARGVSERPERLEIQSDREGVKNAIISLVGNYNRLMAEINVLTARSLSSGTNNLNEYTTRADDSVIRELTYLTADEVEAMKERLGAFNGEATLTQLKENIRRAVTSPYPTDDGRDLSMLAQIGIGTNINRPGGASYSASQMRGYLDIDEKKLDEALERRLPAIKQLFGSDTDGDLLADTGVAFNLDTLSRPFVDKGGIISLKTGTLDSRISQDKRRIETMDRQLAVKEADLKIQYSRMESAYARMEQMASSFDNFSQQTKNNR